MRAGIVRSAAFITRQLAQRGRKCVLQRDDDASAPCPACGQPFAAGDERVKAYVAYAEVQGPPVWVHLCCARAVQKSAPWETQEVQP